MYIGWSIVLFDKSNLLIESPPNIIRYIDKHGTNDILFKNKTKKERTKKKKKQKKTKKIRIDILILNLNKIVSRFFI